MKETNETSSPALRAELAIERFHPVARASPAASAATGSAGQRSNAASGEDTSLKPSANEARYTRPPGVLFCGGFHSTMRGTKADYLRQLSAQHGWAFTRFDYRGHGDSSGDAAELTLHHWLEDTLFVLRSLPAPTIIVGSSMGAWLAVLAALEEPDLVSGLVTLAAAPDFTTELIWPALSTEQQNHLSTGGTLRLPSNQEDAHAEAGWPLHMALFDSGRELSLLGTDTASSLRCPLRLIHGTADADVPSSHSLRLLEKAGTPNASLLLLKGADHRLSDAASLAQIGQSLVELKQSAA